VRELIAGSLDYRPVYATDPEEAWRAWFNFVEEDNAPLYRAKSRTQDRLGHPQE
jgi:hypothetical protein